MFIQPLMLIVTLLTVHGNHGLLYGFLNSPLQPTVNVQQVQPDFNPLQASDHPVQVTVGGNGQTDELQAALGYNALNNGNATITVR